MGKKRNRVKPSQTSKPLQSKDGKKMLSTELIIGVGSLLLSLLAVIVAWQANRISETENIILSKQVTGQLSLEHVAYYGGNTATSKGPDLDLTPGVEKVVSSDSQINYCSYKVRLANRGGAPISVIDYSVEAKFSNDVVKLLGYGESIADSPKDRPFSELPIHKFRSVIVAEEVAATNPVKLNWRDRSDTGVSFPFDIAPGQAKDFVVYTIFQRNPSFKHDGVIVAITQLGSSNEDIEPAVGDYIKHLRLQFAFQSLSNATASTKWQVCASFAMLPPGYDTITSTPTPP